MEARFLIVGGVFKYEKWEARKKKSFSVHLESEELI